MREWTVAGGLVMRDGRLLLVRNRRRWGTHDWSPPGGVIDESDDGVVAGLTREVHEETGILVSRWEGPVYEVSAAAPDMGWHLHAHVFVAREFDGEIQVADPDGIVVDAVFVESDQWDRHLADCHVWVQEPLGEWLEERWGPDELRRYRYAVHGADLEALRIQRVT